MSWVSNDSNSVLDWPSSLLTTFLFKLLSSASSTDCLGILVISGFGEEFSALLNIGSALTIALVSTGWSN